MVCIVHHTSNCIKSEGSTRVARVMQRFLGAGAVQRTARVGAVRCLSGESGEKVLKTSFYDWHKAVGGKMVGPSVSSAMNTILISIVVAGSICRLRASCAV
jgi:hypothetical protein